MNGQLHRIQNTTELYGKTIEQHNDPFSVSLAYRTHYIPNLTADTRPELTPKKRQPALQPCPGCDKHTPYYRDLRPRCVLVSQTKALIKLHVHSSSYIPSFLTNSKKKFNISY